MKHSHYHHLGIMAALSFAAMYALMYSMVDTFGNVYSSLNQVHMAGLMTAPMVVIELAVMGAMYEDKRLNRLIISGSVAALLGLFACLRMQAGISDRQFLRSMIPHHAGAILMCRRAPLKDAEVRKLCESILVSQQAEIDLMRAKLDALHH